MSTIRDLITGSLRLIEEIGAGEVAEASACEDARTALCAMIGSWSIQGDLIYTETTETFTLSSGNRTRTIGPTGNYATTRPINISKATITQGNVSYDLRIVGMSEYAIISDKLESGMPEMVYYDANFPDATLTFWPVPDQTYTLTLYCEKPLSEYSSINDTLTVPPGYERAFRFNLACEIAPEYGKQASAQVMKVAIESKLAIINQNNINDLDRLRVDDALISRGGFDITTGTYR